MTRSPQGDAAFGEWLKDGRVLCALANAIRPGSVRRVNESKMPFKQMENIKAFLTAARALGCQDYEVFETVDLFELKDLGLVVRTIFALAAHAPDHNGALPPLEGVQRRGAKLGQELAPIGAGGSGGEASFWNQGSAGVMQRSHVSTLRTG